MKKNIPTVCYKLDTPITYNGKTYHDTFLLCYVHDVEEAQNLCNELNAKATDRTYFVDEQPIFD